VSNEVWVVKYRNQKITYPGRTLAEAIQEFGQVFLHDYFNKAWTLEVAGPKENSNFELVSVVPKLKWEIVGKTVLTNANS
jgi:hypothetical protein